MTTLLKIEANRDNALASTGPRTAEGRAIVSGNAIRHGLLSWKPVIPGLENPEDWQSHLDRTLDSLAPVGYMETLLAERVALLLWRLGRVARYEREAVAIAAETAEVGWTRYRAGEQFVVNARRRESPLADWLPTFWCLCFASGCSDLFMTRQDIRRPRKKRCGLCTFNYPQFSLPV